MRQEFVDFRDSATNDDFKIFGYGRATAGMLRVPGIHT